MPWKIISLVQGRCRLVKLMLQAHKPVRQLCRIFGVSAPTAYKWKARFLADGRRGMSDRSRKPKHSPRQTTAGWRERIGRLRRRHRRWGAKKIRAHLLQGHPGKRVPAVRTITRWLRRLGLAGARRRRPSPGPVLVRPPLTAARGPNHVWTVDFKGGFRTSDGQRVEPLTVRDLWSRYVLAARLLPDQQWWRARAVFAALFCRYGLPRIIRVDNGSPFGSTGPAGLSRLSAWWTALGIGVEFIRPGHPQDNGGHEQMHRVLKAEAAQPPSRTMRAQQRRLNRWRQRYNQVRPHAGLQERLPCQYYRRSHRCYVRKNQRWKYPRRWQERRVRSNGQIRWQGRLRFIGEAFVGHKVGLQPLGQGHWKVYFCKTLLGELRATDAGGLRPAKYQRAPADTKTKV